VSELKSPMRFSLRNRRIDVENYLRHEDFENKHVTDIDVRPSEGNLYIHWEHDE